MKEFLDDNFLLQSRSAEMLYHEHAAKMPIIDYHSHLPADKIAMDARFDNMTQAWLYGDHYKWRAMRANGIAEEFITGNATDFQKFEKWAKTVPFTARNPLYHWTHMELKKPFGIKDRLNSSNAQSIYEATGDKLRSEFSVRKLLAYFNVKVICTTDDPVDSLEFHQKMKEENYAVRVLPTFRPDKSMAIENTSSFNSYMDDLQKSTGLEIGRWDDFLRAMQARHDFFARNGCKLSDHGLDTFYADEFSLNDIERIFEKVRTGKEATVIEVMQFKSACLIEFALMDAEKGWSQQFHVGALRNNSSKLLARAGADAGADSIGDLPVAKPLSRFLDHLDKQGKLAKTIIYNLNPRDNELIASMLANFNDSSMPGKMQYGAAWWFLDQKDGIEVQLKVLSNMGLLSRFVGMLTDSRSFLSFSRHEYFRRILCNVIGDDIEKGELPNDIVWLGKLVEDICYFNAERYFGF